MIDSSVLAHIRQWRAAFETAKPFKHVCIDNFFIPEIAGKLLDEFPAFDRTRALNEFGAPTGKHAVAAMGSISPLYKEAYDFFRGPAFLKFMSDITGIEDLLFDDTMYGGGTHENIDGQGLAPHVDFNYDQRTGWHRRLNALLYLNPVWDESWGGCIELHKNPRSPDDDESIAFAPLMNRMVIFETNEYSWHGFKRIQIPPEFKAHSRKCLSIYLYTKDRPAEEIVASHGTFYVQPPLPKRFSSGYVMTSEDAAELKSGYRIRDAWIEAYQKGTIKSSAELDKQGHALKQALKNQRVTLKTDQYQLPGTVGVFHDGWVAPHVEIKVASEPAVLALRLYGVRYEDSALVRAAVKTATGKEIAGEVNIVADGYLVRLQGPVNGELTIQLDFSRSAVPATSGDKRPICFNLYRLELVR